jgi:hypothetical protein
MHAARSDDAAIRVARRTLGGFALVGTTAVVWFGFVDPAGAYTPTVKASCVGGQSVLTVEVRDYNGRVTNTVNVQDNQKVLDSRAFGTSYRNSFIRPGNVEHAYRVVVRAGDDRTGDQGFSFERTVPQAVCAQVTPTGAWPVHEKSFVPRYPEVSSSARTTSAAPQTTPKTTTAPRAPAPPVVTTTPAKVTTTTATTTAATATEPPSSEVTTTTTEAHEPPAVPPGQGTEPPGQGKPEETTSAALTTKFLPALVPPLVSLVAPPFAEEATTSSGAATPPPSGTAPSSSSSTARRGDQGAPTPRSTPSFPVTTPEATTRDNVFVVADDTDLPTTGASVAIPLLFGLCLLTAGGVVVFSMRGPRKRGRHAA